MDYIARSAELEAAWRIEIGKRMAGKGISTKKTVKFLQLPAEKGVKVINFS